MLSGGVSLRVVQRIGDVVESPPDVGVALFGEEESIGSSDPDNDCKEGSSHECILTLPEDVVDERERLCEVL